MTQLDPTKPLEADKSLGELFGELSSEFTGLLQTQVELAKVELRDEASKVGKTAGMFGGAALCGYFAVLLLSFAAAWGIATAINTGVAFLIVGLVYAAAALVLYAQARRRADQLELVPKQTVASFKEDVEWARQKLS
jgi:uncharacterized membrane protein YqjE